VCFGRFSVRAMRVVDGFGMTRVSLRLSWMCS
jgi:hypothetical protein